jgi:hypothetical protein
MSTPAVPVHGATIVAEIATRFGLDNPESITDVHVSANTAGSTQLQVTRRIVHGDGEPDVWEHQRYSVVELDL